MARKNCPQKALKEKRAGNLRQARHDLHLPPLDYTMFNIHCISRLQLSSYKNDAQLSDNFWKFLEISRIGQFYSRILFKLLSRKHFPSFSKF